ncbi:flagellar assembly protein H [Maioricimonas rarisocia]|uniref:Flagellar assembly protein FliH n=1 Tax=Maioricimonas rarisocia TaxID=2528026 RepID=A0A517ZCS2_9PLAN|nr:FliH/SctL family protein [Maioricimonas rarisocia]QDU40251.1 flagellar assembly protein H [Maioricimonas rarisocia]
MLRGSVKLERPLRSVRLSGTESQEAAAAREAALSAAPAPPPEPPIAPMLESINEAVEEFEARRKQSLEELQLLAVELAVAAASNLVAQAIDRGEYGIEQLVKDAVGKLGMEQPITISLHPEDIQLLDRRTEGEAVPWRDGRITLRPETGIQRGDCRAETGDGRILIAEMSARLAEMRRHWLEGLDDAQIERRRPAGSDRGLQRFPNRRETA